MKRKLIIWIILKIDMGLLEFSTTFEHFFNFIVAVSFIILSILFI
jgi:hypothetical protein